ncbi:patatin-like phospholipase family protein, partial [Candidatus Parcubacteria bacterium]|nr:patatin-like phospholipase family protein [Candidatus Parcubacteria bacterium]
MTKKQSRIGLALSGGGARGGAHIGVLKVLRQSGIPIDVVTGCSAGAIVGASFAAGALDKLEEFVVNVTKKDVLKLFPPTRSKFYLFDDSGIVPFFERFVDQRSFADLEISLGLVAADVRTREWITLKEGQVALAMRASTSVPCLFKPVEMGGHLLVDGGLISYLPVQAA